MTEPGGIVAPESPFCRGRRNDVGAVDGRILEKGFVREKKWVSKTLENNGGGKVNIIFWLCSRLHPWGCSGRFEGGHPWRWITWGLGPEESFKGANSSGARSADVMEGTGWKPLSIALQKVDLAGNPAVA